MLVLSLNRVRRISLIPHSPILLTGRRNTTRVLSFGENIQPRISIQVRHRETLDSQKKAVCRNSLCCCVAILIFLILTFLLSSVLVDGEFDPSLKSASCRRYDPSNTRQLHRHNYRVELANAIMRQHRIPVLPAFQSSLTYFSTLTPEIVQPHPGDQTNGDCRHWYAPSSPLIQWNEVLYNFIVPN